MNLRVVVIACLVLPLIGCGDIKSLSSSLDSKSEPTHCFWARLQGIHYRDFPEISQKTESLKAARDNYDVDVMAQLFGELGTKHEDMALQFERLDANDVDEEAFAFRNKLVESHRELGDVYKRVSMAAKDRDFDGIQSGNAELAQIGEQYVMLWKSRTAVMTSLGKKYSKDFNVQE